MQFFNVSVIASQAWTEISNNIQCMGDSIKQCAEDLQASTHDKLVNLIEDKKAIKRHYIEQRDRIDSKFIKVRVFKYRLGRAVFSWC